MHKVLWGLAVIAVVIGVIDLQGPIGSRAAAEGTLLLFIAVVLGVAGLVARARSTRSCPKCAERIKRAATRCPHCQADVV